MIQQAGFTGLQLDAASGAIDLPALSSTARREITRLFSSKDLQLTSIRIDLGSAGLGLGADVDRVLDRVDAILNAAAELNAAVVCVDLGRLPPVQRPVKAKPKVTADMAGLIIIPQSAQPELPDPEPMPTRIDPAILSHWQQAMGQLGEIADRYGSVLALASSLSSFTSLASILKQAGCPWFGIDFDPSMLLKDEWSLDEFFDELGSQIRHVRARDAIKGEDRRTKPTMIGRGDVAWRDVLQHLDGADYTGAITLDPSELTDPRAAAIGGLKQLKAVVES